LDAWQGGSEWRKGGAAKVEKRVGVAVPGQNRG
jgi:hypothetical protein